MLSGALLAGGIESSPYLIKPNNHELSGLLGRKLDTTDKLEEAARELMAKYGISKIVVSMGRRRRSVCNGERIGLRRGA